MKPRLTGSLLSAVNRAFTAEFPGYSPTQLTQKRSETEEVCELTDV